MYKSQTLNYQESGLDRRLYKGKKVKLQKKSINYRFDPGVITGCFG